MGGNSNIDRDKLVNEIFAYTLEKTNAAERAAYLAQACGNDAQLRQHIEALLKGQEKAGALLEGPPPAPPKPGSGGEQPQSAKAGTPNGPGGTVILSTPLTEKAGDHIGHYKLLQQIGEGGCGVVYMAEQEQPIRRRVALKVIKLGMDTKAVIARFEAERQALALMDHPNIAKVLDAGATDTGRPYFVMELVRGIKITDYCDQNNLSTDQRLDLFVQICHAIQHAHQKGIIHRDIKPSNILVTVHDGRPLPKIIDFGIAKATSGQVLTDKTLFTAFEQFIGTPAYMSPEQAEMSTLDIDTRSDIYALGVLLYELLTGQTPFDAQELVAAGLNEMRRIIRDREPLRPSTRISTMEAADQTTVARRRHSELPQLIHMVRGDLDWIVMKCLEKDRTRRYDTANGLAHDIQCHLNNEPVLARPPSRLYRFEKLVHRNKLVFAAGAAVVAALALGLCLAGWALVRERAVRARAEAAEKDARTEADKQEAVNKFLNKMFTAADPDALSAQNQTTGGGGTVVEVLDAAAKQLESGALKDRPEIEAAIRQSLGQTYESRGQYAAADEQLRRALELNKKVDGPESPSTARTLSALARLRLAQDKLPEAEQLQLEELAVQRKLHGGKEDPEVARALYDLAMIRMELFVGTPLQINQAKAAEGEAAFREALAMQRRLLPAKDRNVAKTLTGLGRLLIYRDRQDESVQLLDEALMMHKDLLGPEHPDVAFTEQQLSEAKQKQGKLAEAEDLCRQAIAIQRKTLGNDHPAVATSLFRLGEILGAQTKYAESEAAFRESLAIRRKALGEYNIHVAWCLKRLAESMVAQQKVPEAEQLYRESLPIWAKVRGVDSAGYLEAVRGLVGLLKAENKPAEVEALYREVLAVQRTALGEDNAAVAAMLGSLADNLQAQGKKAEAEKASGEALEITLKLGVTDDRLPKLVGQQAEALKRLGKSAEAEKVYEEAIKGARAKLGETNMVLGQLLFDYGDFLANEFKFEAAAEFELKSLPIRRTAQDDNLAWTLRNLGAILVILGRSKEAEEFLREELALYRKLHQQDDFYGTAWAGENLGLALKQQNRLPEAEQTLREALRAFAACNGVGSHEYGDTMQGFVETLKSENKPREAEKLLGERLGQERAALGRTNAIVAGTLAELGYFLTAQNKTNEAASCYREALDIASNVPVEGTNAPRLNDVTWTLVTGDKPSRWDVALGIKFAQKIVGATDRKNPGYLDTLAVAYSVAGQSTNAVRVEQEAIALLKPDTSDEDKAYFVGNLRLFEANIPYRDDYRLAHEAGLLLDEGKFAQAEPLARECLALREIMAPDGVRLFHARSLLGGCLLGQKKYADAEPLLLSGYEGLKQRENKLPPWYKPLFKEAIQRLAQLDEETGRPEQAAGWRKKLAELETDKK